MLHQARQKDATYGEQRLGGEIAASLQKIISPYFLRRTKAEVSRQAKQKERERGTPGDASPQEERAPEYVKQIGLGEIKKEI